MLFSNLNSQDICDSLELFQGIALSLENQQLTALTGPNGSGKSTLLRLLNHKALQAGYSVTFAPQSPPDAPLSEGQKQVYRWLEWMEMGFHKESILLLDEPFRHLDQDFRLRAFSFLHSTAGYKLVVSHDLDFLHHADRIYHLQAGVLQSYGGNLELYRSERHRQAEARKRQSDALKSEIQESRRQAREVNLRQSHRTRKAVKDNETQNIPRSFINRQKNRAERTAARLDRASRRKSRKLQSDQTEAFEQLQTLKTQSGGIVRIPAGPCRKHALVIEGLERSSPSRNSRESVHTAGILLNETNMQMERDEIIWLQGSNGAGKSRFLESILGFREHDVQVRWGTKPFYLRQNLDHFRSQASLEELLPSLWATSCPMSPFPDHPARKRWKNLLGYCGISGNALMRSGSTFSGGERMKVMLSMAAVLEPGIVILDEPEQNLDLAATEELLETLNQYEGAILFVSHDSSFAGELKPDRIWKFRS